MCGQKTTRNTRTEAVERLSASGKEYKTEHSLERHTVPMHEQSWPALSGPSLRAGRRSTSGILDEQPGRALVWSIALVLKGERSHAPCQLHKILHLFCTVHAVPHQTSPAYLSAVITCCRTVPWHVRAGRRPPHPLALAVNESLRSPMVQNSRISSHRVPCALCFLSQPWAGTELKGCSRPY